MIDTRCFIITIHGVHYTIFPCVWNKNVSCRREWLSCKGRYPYQSPRFNRRLKWDIQFPPWHAGRQPGPAEVSGAPRSSEYVTSSPHTMGSLIRLQSPAIPLSLGFLPSQLGGWAPLGWGWGRGAPPSLSAFFTTPSLEDERSRTAWGVNL